MKKKNSEVMSTQEAFEIVYELAYENSLCSKQDEIYKENIEEAKHQQLALDTVHDFLVNNIYDEEE
jgi:hypothetical protein